MKHLWILIVAGVAGIWFFFLRGKSAAQGGAVEGEGGSGFGPSTGGGFGDGSLFGVQGEKTMNPKAGFVIKNSSGNKKPMNPDAGLGVKNRPGKMPMIDKVGKKLPTSLGIGKSFPGMNGNISGKIPQPKAPTTAQHITMPSNFVKRFGSTPTGPTTFAPTREVIRKQMSMPKTARTSQQPKTPAKSLGSLPGLSRSGNMATGGGKIAEIKAHPTARGGRGAF